MRARWLLYAAAGALLLALVAALAGMSVPLVIALAHGRAFVDPIGA